MENVFIYTREVAVCGSLSGYVTTPKDFDPTAEALPMIVFLNGAGERGPNIENVAVHAIPKLFTRDPDYHGLRVITVSPQCPADMTWNHLAFPVMDWIKSIAKELNADEKCISVTGLSMGGFGTWELLCTFPDFFSCGAPVCGGGLSWRAGALKGQKIRVFHSVDDTVVPFSYSEQMVSAAKANGADVMFFPTDRHGHNCWDYAYEQTDLIEWLVSNSK